MFYVGDLVWAKLRGFPFWPSQIADPSEPNAPSKPVTPKKPQHLVFFFGTENYAWITDDFIVPHSEEMLEACSKKKSSSLQKAIASIIEESTSRPFVQNREYEEISKEPLQFVANARKQLLKARKTAEGSLRARYSAKTQTASNGKYLADIRKKARKQHVTKETRNALSAKKVSRKVRPKKVRNHGVAVIRPLDNELPPAVSAQCINCTDKTIGFLGLGKIGRMIVKHLMNFGHDVTVWNRSPEKCEEFVKAGAQQAHTPADVIKNCDITFCCVSGPDAVKDIMFSNFGVISGLEECRHLNKGYVEMTSIDPITSEEIAEAILARGGKYLEAIASGTKELVETGSLLILSSGDYQLFNSCESCFFTIASKVFFLGSVVGSGCKMNLLLSAFMGSMYAAVAESMALIRQYELSQNHFLEFLSLGPLRCPALLDKGNAINTGNYSAQVEIRHQQRDLSLALSMSEVCRHPMPIATQANQLFKRAKSLGMENQDVAAVYFSTQDY